MRPYSKDLRLRVLAAVDAGTPREQVAKTFSLGVGAHDKTLAQEASGDRRCGTQAYPRQALQEGYDAPKLAAKAPGGQRRPYPRGTQRGFRGRVRGGGLHLHCGEGHLQPARWWMADQKKSKIAQERDEEARGLWQWLASHFDARRLVFVDESGFNISMTRLRARAPRGKRGPTARFQGTGERTLP